MQKLKLLLLTIPLLLLSFSCDKVNSSDDEEKPNELKGSTDIEINSVGNEISAGSVLIGGTYHDLENSASITKVENGIATVRIKADFSSIPQLQKFMDLIPSQYKNSEGKLDADFKFKFTDKGIQDFINRDHAAHTIVKYDCKVGDQYNYTKSNGKTISRTVTAKSETDDYSYGFYNIKVITVEQDSRIPGIEKVIYYANHKFGLVGLKVLMEDGTEAKTTIYN